ncbi:MAG: putative transposase [Acidimicrobiales bacterium]
MSVAEVLRGAGIGDVRHGLPLPLAPAGSVEINRAAHLLETDEGGVVFLWGMATWCWEPDDIVGRRLAAVSLVETKAATPSQVAVAFDVNFETVRRWRRAWAEAGTEGLVPKQRGHTGPVKLTEAKVAQIRALHEAGMGLRATAREVGLDPSTVRRGLSGDSSTSIRAGSTETNDAEGCGALEPLARPEERVEERQLARAGLLTGAEPVITQGASLPYAGALLVLPALAVTGLLEAFDTVFASGRAAFYSIRSLVLSLVFATLVGAARVEGLTRIDPADIGRLIGLDRVPEVKTMRRRMEELARRGSSAQLLRKLAEAHLDNAKDADGLFYIDGHVRAYHGTARLPKAHLARARLAAPAEVDTWITDARGDGVLVWSAPPGASLSGELRQATTEIRSLVGPKACPTVAFDRGGWSPKLFAELVGAGFDVLTYRKAPVRPEPRSAFRRYRYVDDLGRKQVYWLAERAVRLAYVDEKNKRRHFLARQVTRLDPDTGHQTQIITTRQDLSAPQVAFAMFCRWREENFFRYVRANYGLDALDSYAKIDDDAERSVPNPAKAAIAAQLKKAKAALAEAEAALGAAATDNVEGIRPTMRGFKIANAELRRAVDVARANLEALKATQASIPTRVPLGELHPDAARLAPERKRLHDAIRMATYNATSSLARMLAPHYKRAEDEARMVLSEAFHSPADVEIVGDELHVRINPLSAPRRSRAIAGLCRELNATETLYPGTELRLIYSVKDS